jgi:hypothetical protein
MKKIAVIEINGRRYDAHTGERLDAEIKPAPAATSTAKAQRPHRVASHAQPHAPATSKLLMRKAVKRPAAVKPKLKVQGALTVAQPLSELSAPNRSQKRLARAHQFSRSQQISHFVRGQAEPYPIMPLPTKAQTYQVRVQHMPVALKPAGRQPQTTSEMLEAALQAANSHEAKPLPRSRQHKRRLFGRLRTA